MENKKLIDTTLEEFIQLIDKTKESDIINIYTIMKDGCDLRKKSPIVRFIYFVVNSKMTDTTENKSELYREYKLIGQEYSTASIGALFNRIGESFSDIGTNKGSGEKRVKREKEILEGTENIEQLIDKLIETMIDKESMKSIKSYLMNTTVNDILQKYNLNLPQDFIENKKAVEEDKEEPTTQKIDKPELLLETLEKLKSVN